MTTPEHAALAVSLGLAVRLHERYGVAMLVPVGLAAVSPDWDGLAGFVDLRYFDHGHRVWGHGILPAVVMGAVVAAIATAGRLGERAVVLCNRIDGIRLRPRNRAGVATAAFIGAAAAASHIPADIVVSGAEGIRDWPVSILWPLDGPKVVYPMLRWGDPGPTLMLAGGLIVAALRPRHAVAAARTGLLVLGVYLIVGRMRVLMEPPADF